MSNPETTLSKEELTDPNTTASDLLYNVEPPPIPPPMAASGYVPSWWNQPTKSREEFDAEVKALLAEQEGRSTVFGPDEAKRLREQQLAQREGAGAAAWAPTEAAQRARLLDPGVNQGLEQMGGQFIPARADYTPEEVERLANLLGMDTVPSQATAPQVPTVETPAVATAGTPTAPATAGTPTATSGVADAVAAAAVIVGASASV